MAKRVAGSEVEEVTVPNPEPIIQAPTQMGDSVAGNTGDTLGMRPKTARKIPLGEWAEGAGVSGAGIAALQRVTKMTDRHTASEWLSKYNEEMNREV